MQAPSFSKLSVLALLLTSQQGFAVAQTILIRGGTVVNSDREFLADVLVGEGKIIQVADSIEAPRGAVVLDAAGKYVLPGGIDPHTHLAMPFMGTVSCDDFYSGQAAALAGGTTMHIDFALPVNHDLAEGFKAWQGKAAKAVMDYGFHMAVTTWNDKVAADMEALVAGGINSFKFFMAYKGALQVTDEQLIHGLRRCKELGALPQVHAENGDAIYDAQQRLVAAGITGPEGHPLSRPAVLEGEATGRAIRLARYVGAPLYVVHVMSPEALAEVAAARLAGQRVIGEPVASGLALNHSKLWDADFRTAAQYVMSPPIRGPEAAPALRRALAGGALHITATDHCAFNSSQKAAGRHDFRLIPNGVNGIEERLHVVWQEMVVSGLMRPSDFVRVTSSAAAQVFNIYPQKGVIAEGSDADIILLDPAVEHTISAGSHHSRMDTNIYEGMKIKGKVVSTISRGRLVWHEGRLDVTEGTGRFVSLPPFGPLYNGLEQEHEAWLRSNFPQGEVAVRRDGDLPLKDEL